MAGEWSSLRREQTQELNWRICLLLSHEFPSPLATCWPKSEHTDACAVADVPLAPDGRAGSAERWLCDLRRATTPL